MLDVSVDWHDRALAARARLLREAANLQPVAPWLSAGQQTSLRTVKRELRAVLDECRRRGDRPGDDFFAEIVWRSLHLLEDLSPAPDQPLHARATSQP